MPTNAADDRDAGRSDSPSGPLRICSDPECDRRHVFARVRSERRCERCGAPLELPVDATTVIVSPAAPTRLVDEGVSPRSQPGGRSRLGRFLDPVEIARGGMGVVLRAVDPELRRPVALKVLAPGSRSEPAAVDRFFREARIAGQLEHPNIVPVYELGSLPRGEPYLAMKLIDGSTLADVLRGGRLPATSLLSAFLKVLDAVAFAHSRGVVHRDLKPANVMIGAFGEVQVMDWGVARVLGSGDRTEAGREPAGGRSGKAPLQTLEGTVLGTPAYMAPEQAQGRIEAVDARSDVYSLGAILYEILTGRAPFRGSDPWKILRAVAEGKVVPPSRRGRAVPRELEAVVLKAMARDPADRYQRVEDLAADVEAWNAGRTLGAARYNPAQRLAKWVVRHRSASTAAVLVLATAAGLLGWSRWRSRQERVERVREAVAEAERSMSALPSEPGTDEAIERCLAAASALERALQASPGDGSIRDRRRAVGVELGRAALAGGDHALARRAFLDLADYGSDPAEVEELLSTVEDARTEGLRRRAERLTAIVDDLARGLSRADRDPADPLLEDHVDEASGFRDAQTVEVLGRALAPLIEKAGREGAGAAWREGEESVARFACRVLGRLGSSFPEAVTPLARWLEVVHDRELVVEAARALCNTRRPEAGPAVLALRDRLGAGTDTWFRIRGSFRRIPEWSPSPSSREPSEWIQAGTIRLERGDAEGAVLDFTRAIELDPGSADGYLNRGLALDRLGRRRQAADDLSRAVELDPASDRALGTRGNARLGLGDGAGAVADLLRAAELDPADAAHHSDLGVALKWSGDLEGALAAYDRALAIDPDARVVLINRGIARRESGDFHGALADLDRVLAIDPGDVNAPEERGLARFALGDLEGAIADYGLAIERDPRRASAYHNRALAREAFGDDAGALDDLGTALEIDPKVAATWLVRGAIRHRRGEVEEAHLDFTRSIELDPGLAEACAGLGWTDRSQEPAIEGR